jgi:hypothetical protein
VGKAKKFTKNSAAIQLEIPGISRYMVVRHIKKEKVYGCLLDK